MINLKRLKRDVPITAVVAYLGLNMTEHTAHKGTEKEHVQLRGPCPACAKGGDRVLVVTPHKGVFYCHADGDEEINGRGSIIDLVMHIRGGGITHAATFIKDQHKQASSPAAHQPPAEEPAMKAYRATPLDPLPATAKAEREQKKGIKPFDPSAYADGLDTRHPLVAMSGLSEEFCKKHRMGVATKGVHAGRIAFPCIDLDTGEVVFASAPEIRLPKKWGSNGS